MPGCQHRHLRLNAPVQGLAWYVTLLLRFLFERWYLDIEELQTHHIQQIILTTNGVTSSCLFQFRFVVTTLFLWPCL